MKYAFTFIVELREDENPTELLDYFEQSIQENLDDPASIKEATVESLSD